MRGVEEVVSGVEGMVMFAEGVMVGCEDVVSVEMGNGTAVAEEVMVAVAAIEAIEMLAMTSNSNIEPYLQTNDYNKPRPTSRWKE